MDSLRRQLTEKLADLVCELSGAQAEALAIELERLRTPKKIRSLGGGPAPKAVSELYDLWIRVSVDGEYLADAVRCAARAVRTATAHEKVELLYTGPGAGTIRRTEQGLLEVIRSASESLWVVSYVVATGVDDILAALQERAEAGVDVSILIDHRIDNAHFSFSRLARDAPGCTVLEWPDEHRDLGNGRFAALHAKCAIADGRRAFVSSANLTGQAMDDNLEVGYLVTGGSTPQTLEGYLDRLVETEVLRPRDGD
jgi:cardiolipin synthase A/B